MFMQCKELEELILTAMPAAKVKLSGGEGRYRVSVSSNQFSGLSVLDRHRLIYAALQEQIADGTVHALSIDECSVPDDAK